MGTSEQQQPLFSGRTPQLPHPLGSPGMVSSGLNRGKKVQDRVMESKRLVNRARAMGFSPSTAFVPVKLVLRRKVALR